MNVSDGMSGSDECALDRDGVVPRSRFLYPGTRVLGVNLLVRRLPCFHVCNRPYVHNQYVNKIVKGTAGVFAKREIAATLTNQV